MTGAEVATASVELPSGSLFSAVYAGVIGGESVDSPYLVTADPAAIVDRVEFSQAETR